MKVLVTGATGFIGSAITRKLLQDGHDVRALVRSREKLAGLGLGVNDVVEGDITDSDSLRRAADSVELIYSIAGTFREPNLSDKRYHEVNVDAVRYLLEASLEHGVKRVVHCSTCGIHGNIVGHPANEEYPIRPVGIYEETKAAGEKLALDYGRSTGLDVVILRPTPVYGPGDTRLLKLFKLVSKKWAVLLGPGTAGYHLVYIDDLVDAFLLAGTVEDAAGEPFLIGGSETPSLNAVIAALAEVLNNQDQHIVRLPAWPFWLAGWGCELLCRPLGVSPPIYRRRVEFFTNNRAYDIGKAQSILGYQPRVKMREGLKHTADWYRANALL